MDSVTLAPLSGDTGIVALEQADSTGVDRVILIPDEFLARNVAAQTTVGIIAWKGRCEVHERFTVDDIAEMRAAFGVITVVFAYTLAVNIIKRPDGLEIATFFIVAILATSVTSRMMRSRLTVAGGGPSGW